MMCTGTRAALLVALSLSAARAQLSPAWAQYRSTAQHAGDSSLSGPPAAVPPPESWSYPSPDGSAIISSPAIAGDGTAVFMTQDGTVVAIKPYAAAPSWVFNPAAGTVPLAYEAAPAMAFISGTNVVFVAAGTYIYCLLMSNGQLSQQYNTQVGYGNITFPPSVGASYLAVPSSTSVLIFQNSFISNLAYTLSGFVPSGPVSSIDDEPIYGYCVFFVTTTNTAVKYCPQYSQFTPMWTYPLPEASPFAPVIVASISTVFFVTGGPVSYIVGLAAFGLTNASYCTTPGQFGSALGGAPAWVGGDFGLAAVSSLASGAAVLLSGPLPSSACTLVASVAGTPPSVGSALAIDANRTGFYGATDGTLVALDLSSATPRVAWTTPLLGGGAVLSSPAIGPSRNTVLGSGAFLVSLKPICGAGAYYSQALSACLPCAANSFQPLTNASALACTLCPAGTDTGGNTSCTSAAACGACAAGRVGPTAGSPCRNCTAGSYSLAGATNCTLCPAGSASSVAAAPSAADCVACAPGSAAAAGAVNCSGCVAGTWAPGGAANCSADAQSCYTGAGAGADCGAALPYAQFGADTAHSSRVAGAGPVALPAVVSMPIFSVALPVSGLALGPSGGVVASLPADSLFFVGTSLGVLGVSSFNGAVVNNYAIEPMAFPGSPAVAPWGWLYVVDASFTLHALPALEAAAPYWSYAGIGAQPGYIVTPPAVHSVTRAVYYNAGPAGIACVDGIAGTRRWVFEPGAACSSTPALDIAGSSVYVGCDDSFVYSLAAATGTEQWSYRTGGLVRASPVLSADGALIFAATMADNLLALDSATGVLRYLPVAVSPAAALATPAVSADAVIVALTDGTVFAASNNVILWKTRLDGPVIAPPTLGAANASLGAPGGTAYVGTLNGSLYALDAPTGAIRWQLALGEPIAQPAVILARGDTLLIPSNRSAAVYFVQSLAATTSASPSATATAAPSPPPSSTASSALVISLSVALSVVSAVGVLVGVAYARGFLHWGAARNEKVSLLNPLLVATSPPAAPPN